VHLAACCSAQTFRRRQILGNLRTGNIEYSAAWLFHTGGATAAGAA